MIESPLRDLARQLRDLARNHLAYSQVVELMNHVDSHLAALAFHEEVCRTGLEPAPAIPTVGAAPE